MGSGYKFLKIFIPTIMLLTLISGLVFYQLYKSETKNSLRALETTEKNKVSMQLQHLEEELNYVMYDINVLANLPGIAEYVEGVGPLSRLHRAFLAFSYHKHQYAVIRIMDESGMEENVVTQIDSKPHQILKENYANRKNEDYFYYASKLNKRQIFLSEYKKSPYLPLKSLGDNSIICFSTPLFNSSDKFKGVVAISLHPQFLSKEIESFNVDSVSSTFLVKKNGENILSTNEALNNKIDFKDNFIANKNNGQIYDKRGLITFGSMDFFNKKLKTEINHDKVFSNYMDNWKIVSFVSNDKINSIKLSRLKSLLYYSVLVFVLIVIISLYVSITLKSRIIMTQQIEDRNDYLVKVINSNRSPFFVVDINTSQIELSNSAAEEMSYIQNSFIKENDPILGDIFRPYSQIISILNESKSNLCIEKIPDDDSDLKCYEIILNPVIDKSGALIQVIISLTDITSRKLAELNLENRKEELERLVNERTEELQNERDLLNMIINTIPDQIYVKTPDRKLFLINNAVLEANGRTYEEIINKTDREIFGDKLGEFYESSDNIVFYEKRTAAAEEFTIDKDGKYRYFESIKTPMFDKNGNIIFLVGVGRDLSLTRAAELENRKLSSAIKHSFSHIVIMDKEAQIEFVNPGFTKNTGYAYEEAVGKSILFLFDQNNSNYFQNTILKTLFEGNSWSGEISGIRKDGSVFWVLANIVPILAPHGDIINFIQVAQDITAIKGIQEELKQSEEKYRTLTSAAQDAIISIDSSGKIIYWNPAAVRIFGYTETEVIGKEVHKLIAPQENSANIKQALSLFSVNGKGELINNVHEFEAKRKNGERFTVEISVSSVNIKGNWQAISVIRDISERILTKQKIYQSEIQFRKFIENSRDGIVLTDSFGKVIEWNQAQEEIFELSKDEVIGKPFEEILYERLPGNYRNYKRQLDIKKRIESILINGEYNPEETIEYSFIGKTGIIRTFQEKIFPIVTPKGYLIGAITRDISVQKQIEQKLKRNQDVFKNLFERAPVGITITNEQGILEYANNTHYEMFEIDEEIIGKHFSVFASKEYYDDQFFKRISDVHDRFFISLEEPVREWNFKTWKGNKITIISYSCRIIGFDGRPKKVTYSVDITKNKRNEELLSIQRDLSVSLGRTNDRIIAFEIILNHILSLEEINLCTIYSYDEAQDIFILSAHGGLSDEIAERMKYINKQSELYDYFKQNKSFYFSDNELNFHSVHGPISTGTPLKAVSFVPIMHEGKIIGSFNSASYTRTAFSQETRTMLETIVTLISGLIVRIDNEHKILESQANLENMFNSIDDLVFITDNNGKIIMANKQAVEKTGYTLFQLVNMNMIELVELNEKSKVLDNLRTISLGDSDNSLDVPIQTKNGSIIPFSSKITRGIWNNKLALYGIYRDMSNYKKLTNELIIAKEQSEKANKAKTEFLANMSHEIRTPMNSVIGFSDLLLGMTVDKKQKSYIEAIRASSNNLLKLINDILDLSKIESGKLEINKAPVDTHKLVKEIEQIFELTIKQKNLKFIIHIDDDLNKDLYLDEVRLRQILFNLIGNAVKFTHDGYVKLSVTKTFKDKQNTKVDLKLEVEDTGIGIPPEEQSKIFESFHQQQGQNISKYGGTGLGLTISKRLCELMGASISLKSELGKGSTFTIKIKDVDVSTAEKAEIETTSGKIIFEKSNILVVDDVYENRELMKEIFLETAVNVIEADSAEKLPLLFKSDVPDIVFMDLMMPGMNGYEACKLIKQNEKWSKAPVIALTASSGIEKQKKYKDSGFNGYLLKPIKIKDLYNLMKLYIAHDDENVEFKPYVEINYPEDQKNEKLEEMIIKLQSFYDDWEEAKLNLNNESVAGFADKIIELGKNYSYEMITNYGMDLHEEINSFDSNFILKLLNLYPDLVNNIKKLTEN